MKFVSVICPVLNEEKFIYKCVDSIIAQDYPMDSFEVLFVDGMSTDKTREIIQAYNQQYKYIKLLDNFNKIVPYALNLGIEAAKGEVIIRLDGHCEYPTNYISTLVMSLYELNADNVGAVWNTLPANDTSVCRAIALCSSHWFGVGNSKHKIGVEKVMEVDTVPFGCYRREVFNRIGLFDEELIRNQDDEFNARLINHGGKICLIPQLVVNYIARDSINKMVKMYYQYGLFKPLVNKKLGKPATIRQFFPALFILGIIFGAILSPFSEAILTVYIFILYLYFFISFLLSIKNAISNKDWKLLILMPYTFLCIHVSYGVGYLVGICKIVLHKRFVAEINR